MVLRVPSVWFSNFDTAHLTDLGSKTGYRRLTSLKMSNNLPFHHAGGKHFTILRLPNVKSGRRPIMKKSKFYSGLFVFVHLQISQCKFCLHGVHVEYRARDLHDFFNISSQTVDVRKARKIVMKSEIVLNTTNKTHIKNVCIFDHEKNLDRKNC